MSIHRRPDGSQVNVGLLRHALLGGTSLVSTPAFSADFTILTSLPSWLSFSRASNAMVTDSTGNLTYAPNNILLHSDDLSNAAWTNDGTLSITSGVSDPDGGTSAQTLTTIATDAYVFQSYNAVAGLSGNWIPSVWIRRRTGTGTVHFKYPDNTDNTVTISSSWTRIYIKGSVTANNPGMVIEIIGAGSGADAIDVYHPQLEQVTYETAPRAYNPTTASRYYGPRSDFAWNGSAWVAKGLLIEEQRTNLVKSSGAIGDANWTPGGGGMSASLNSAASPDGGTNASSLTLNLSHFYQQFAPSTGSVAASVWLRVPSGTGTIYLGLVGTSTTVYTTCNLTTTWQRFTVVNSACGNPSYLTIGDDGVHAPTDCQAWGAQAEDLSSFPTSYIPTTTAAVTRSADIVQLTGAALAVFQGAAYSVVMKITDTHPSFYANYLYLDGGAGVAADILRQHGNLTVDLNSNSAISGGTELSVLLGSDSTAGPLQIAFGTDASGRSIAGNGGSIASDANTPSRSPTAAYIGARSDGSSFASDMHLAGIALYSSRLSDTDLQAKSVVGAAF